MYSKAQEIADYVSAQMGDANEFAIDGGTFMLRLHLSPGYRASLESLRDSRDFPFSIKFEYRGDIDFGVIDDPGIIVFSRKELRRDR